MLEHHRLVADLDLQLGHQFAADVVGDAREGLVVDARAGSARAGAWRRVSFAGRARSAPGASFGGVDARCRSCELRAGPDRSGAPVRGRRVRRIASALDCLDLAPGRGFSSPGAAVHNYAGISDMARGDVRIAITLACEECKHRNYQTNKSKRNNPDRITPAQVLPLVS